MRRIISCYFAGPGTGERWTRLARVFAHSARTHCPGWQLVLAKLPPPQRYPNASDSHSANTVKLEWWGDQVEHSADGDEILLIDSDTVILRPLDDVWLQPFDIAYTVRPPDYPHPINGGVIFMRVSPTTRLFMAKWVTANRAMVENRQLRDRWRKYAGINQRALGQLLEEQGAALGQLLALPCGEWNCEDSAWTSFDPDRTRILHLKSALRSAIDARGGFGRPNAVGVVKPHLNALARRWMALQDEAARAGAASQ